MMSKYDIVNKFGQRAGNCIDFDNSGRHGNCQLYPDWQDVNHPCVICLDGRCKKYSPERILTS